MSDRSRRQPSLTTASTPPEEDLGNFPTKRKRDAFYRSIGPYHEALRKAKAARLAAVASSSSSSSSSRQRSKASLKEPLETIAEEEEGEEQEESEQDMPKVSRGRSSTLSPEPPYIEDPDALTPEETRLLKQYVQYKRQKEARKYQEQLLAEERRRLERIQEERDQEYRKKLDEVWSVVSSLQQARPVSSARRLPPRGAQLEARETEEAREDLEENGAVSIENETEKQPDPPPPPPNPLLLHITGGRVAHFRHTQPARYAPY